MQKLTLLVFLLLFTGALAQQHRSADTLSRYTPMELILKGSMATKMKETAKESIYYDYFFNSNPPDSLKSEAYYTLAHDYYTYTDRGVNYSISMLNKALEHDKSNAYNQALSLNSLCSFYALKDDNKKVLACLKKMNALLKSGAMSYSKYLKIQSVSYQIYTMIGDFDRAVSGYKKANRDIDNYLVQHRNLSHDVADGLTYDKKTNFIWMAVSYNYQKKLDSSYYCIQKVKQFEKMGYIHSLSAWYPEALYYVLKNQPDKAIAIAKAAKEEYNTSKIVANQALYCIALSYQQKGDHENALRCCEEALQNNIRIFSFVNYETEFYKIAAESAEKLKDKTLALAYSEKYFHAIKNLDYQKKASFISNLYDQEVIDPLGDELSRKKRNTFFFIFSAVLIISSILLYQIWKEKQSKREKKKFLETIGELEKRELRNAAEKTSDRDVNKVAASTSISEDTIKKILRQLDAFERKQQFTSPTITAGSLAADFGTNVVYLSSLIKKIKNQNFNNYINELRIDYIVSKLKSNPEYINYKISYLATQCGFTSHGTFIRVFTLQKGIAPSKFIQLLRDSRQENI